MENWRSICICGRDRISKSCRASSGRWAQAPWGIHQLQQRNRPTPNMSSCHRQVSQVSPVMRALVLSPRAIHAARRRCPAALQYRGTHAAEPASCRRSAWNYQSRRALSHAQQQSCPLSHPPTVEPTIYALSTASGRAAIAVIRVSGPACKRVCTQWTSSSRIASPD